MSILEGKVAIITGAAGGIGSAIARRFIAEGAAVLLCDIDETKVKSLAMSLQTDRARVLGLRSDVTRQADWERAFDTARSELGIVDVVVNNAGVAHVASIEDIALDDWRKVMATNLESVFLGTQLAIREMRNRGGAIINMASIRAIRSNPGTVAYDTSKAGVVALTRSAALHCARMGYAIRINAVLPGYVGTEMVRTVLSHQPDPEKALHDARAKQPLGRFAGPEEIANGVLFLASSEASFMIGAELVLDGGYTV